MNYEEFKKFLYTECCHETIYRDSEGVDNLVIRVLDAFEMYNKMKRFENFRQFKSEDHDYKEEK